MRTPETVRGAIHQGLRSARAWMRRHVGIDIVRTRPRVRAVRDGHSIPDLVYYTPLFAPWTGYGPFALYYDLAAPYTLVTRDRCWVLYSTARQCMRLPGEFWECGVYKGGTARMLGQLLADSPRREADRLRLFDTFRGMPETDAGRDAHQAGDFADTSLDAVRARVGHAELVTCHPGIIPRSFGGLEGAPIAFAHVDVDIYQAVLDCCDFIFPRLLAGGVMVFDDYGFPSCPGARQAVDEYFTDTRAVPLVLPTGQALVFKTSAAQQNTKFVSATGSPRSASAA